MSILLEKDVGMTEYIGKHKGFTGILKMRYQDFMVNEIDLQGKVVHLTNFDTEVVREHEPIEEKAVLHIPNDVLSAEDIDGLKNLDGNTEKAAFFVIKTVGMSKSQRTEIHKTVSQLFPKLETKTVKNETTDEQEIKVMKFFSDSNKRKRSNKDRGFPYCKFVLYKENIATMDAVNLILKKLNLRHARCFQYAGNKDKRGVTVQEVTTSISPERLVPVNQILSNIRVGNLVSCKTAKRLGDLNGNQFSIVIRNTLDIEESDLKAAIKSFSQTGFINYFGMQRFGTNNVPTYEIGKSIISSRWEETVDLILSSCFKDCSEETINLIRNWREENNAKKAFDKLNRRSSFEGYLLLGISHFGPKQLVQSLARIPRNTRMLYLHSYQSFVWNRIVSRRFLTFGDSPVVGDLVLAGNEKEVYMHEENIDNYSIHDVIMPLPGHKVTYPTNSALQWYKDEFKAAGIEESMFDHKVKEYYLPGAYRKIINKPNDVEWDIVKYNDYQKPLLASDKDILQGGERPSGEKDGKFTALRISFSLSSSCYATVAMREVMKRDMSSANQTLLGDKHKMECSNAAPTSVNVAPTSVNVAPTSVNILANTNE
uniref:Pseudouridylate synthase 7 homolog n=1 Tax=Ciona intestinalis TaxID=7719 RepID=F6PJM3_CIOIN